MSFCSLCSSITRKIIPVSSIIITGKQTNLLAQLRVQMTFKNTSTASIPVTFAPSPDQAYEIHDINVNINGEHIGPIDTTQRKPMRRSSSIEDELLASQSDNRHEMGQLAPNDTCDLVFHMQTKCIVQKDENYNFSLQLLAPSGSDTINLITAFTPDVKFSFRLQLALTHTIEDITANCPNMGWTKFSAKSGEVIIDQQPLSSNLSIVITLTTVPLNANQKRPETSQISKRYFSFAPLIPTEVIEKLNAAKLESEIPEKACFLAQAIHGFQMNNEQLLRQRLQDVENYSGDILGIPETPNAELISTVQIKSWMENDIVSVYSPYTGNEIHNRVNKWNGRSLKSDLIHCFLTNPFAIILLCLILISIIGWIVFNIKDKNLTFFSYLLFAFIILYVAVCIYYFFGGGNNLLRKVNSLCINESKDFVDEFAHAIPNGMYPNTLPAVKLGRYFYDNFYNIGFDVLCTLTVDLSKNPQHPVYSDPKSYKSYLFLHRYMMPLIFQFHEADKMKQVKPLIEGFRKIIVNALIQGSEEIKNSLEQTICDSFLTAEERVQRPLNMRHFTIDTYGVLSLFKSVSNTLSGRKSTREPLGPSFMRLNREIYEAEARGVVADLKHKRDISPLGVYYL